MATYWENSCSFGLRYVSWYKYLIVSLVFSHLGFWSGNLFLIAPFPDLCLLVPFDVYDVYREVTIKQADRDKRGEDTGTKFKNIAPGHRVQLWRAFCQVLTTSQVLLSSMKRYCMLRVKRTVIK